MSINDYLLKNSRKPLSPKVVCKDGFTMSVQASAYHYCSPRVNDAPAYESMEIGFPSEKEDLIMEYAEEYNKPTNTVYGWVPCEVIDAVIEKHGGLVETKCLS